MLEDIELISLKDLSFNDEIEETGSTFSENSYIKAKTIYDIFKIPTIADDSGLVVEALGGEPGVRSHRYAGDDAKDSENTDKVIDKLKSIGLSTSKASFICSLTYVDGERTISVSGQIDGRIILDKRGYNGFGYDPIFYLDEYGKTFAELPLSIKDSISHRHNALVKLKEALK